jgi:hypothetical protein
MASSQYFSPLDTFTNKQTNKLAFHMSAVKEANSFLAPVFDKGACLILCVCFGAHTDRKLHRAASVLQRDLFGPASVEASHFVH